jgi:two-component system chemotaxis sensor kinase CheA
MSTQLNADFLKRLMATFLVEAREHVEALGSGLLELQTSASREAQVPLIETLFREAHSLKGAAGAVNAGEVERLCQTLEGTFGALKTGKQVLSTEIIEDLHRSVTVLGQRVDALAAGHGNAAGERQTPETVPASKGPPAAVRVPLAEGPPAAVRVPPVERPPAAARVPLAEGPPAGGDTVRIATSKLDAIFLQAEELLGVKLAWAERTLELGALAAAVAERDRLWATTVPLVRSLREHLAAKAVSSASSAGSGAALTELSARLLAHLDQDREQAEAVSAGVADLVRGMAADRRRFDTLLERLLDDVKRTLMLPFATILAGFPKLVHDLARDADKDIAFELRGSETEIDKRILERIKDALLHVVRNSIDHGIEPAAERIRRGKAPRASVALVITQAGGKVDIQITDDGAGIDGAAVKAAAVRSGLLAAGEAEALCDLDAVQLVFRSGVTTRREVTTLSGRGLGMAIVQESVAMLGGTVSLESALGVGTTIRILLPLTLATLRGTLVRVANRDFVIPTTNVVRVLRLPWASVKRLENRDSICLDGATLSLVRLADVLGLTPVPAVAADNAPLTLLVLGQGQACMAFAVEQVVGEQEVLAKPLGRLLPRVRNLAGATVFGSGRVVPILDVSDLLATAVLRSQTTRPEPGTEEAIRAKRLLVVDDSITTRTMVQSILDSAGYEVKTAPDGSAALNTLRNERFDLVISDVEMPRMNGFELTKRIREDPALAELPIVLVTAREAQEDRERGIDAGANAYIVKSSFSQGDLLEVIGRLI